MKPCNYDVITRFRNYVTTLVRERIIWWKTKENVKNSYCKNTSISTEKLRK
jgi:hypothetical protein